MDGWLKARRPGEDGAPTKKDTRRRPKPGTAAASKRSCSKATSAASLPPGKAKGRVRRGGTASARRGDDDSYDDDDSDDLGGFIVADDERDLAEDDDEDEFDEDGEESDSDDEPVLDDKDDSGGDDDSVEVIEAPGPRSHRASARGGAAAAPARGGNGKRGDADKRASSSDDDDDWGGFMDSPIFAGGASRQSAPSKLLRQNASAATARRTPSLPAAKLRQDRRRPTDSLAKLDSVPAIKNSLFGRGAAPDRGRSRTGVDSDSDDVVSSPSPAKRMKPTETKIHVLRLDDEDERQDAALRKPPPATEKPTTSRFFNGTGRVESQLRRKETIEIHSDQEESRAAGKLEDTPEPAKQTRKLLKLKKYKCIEKGGGLMKNGPAGKLDGIHLDDSSDSEMEAAIKRSRLDQFAHQVPRDLPDDCSVVDTDDEKLMKKVIKESKKTAANEVSKKAAAREVTEVASNDEVASVQSILDESSDEDDGPDEDYSQQKEAAITVLKATELLSSQVVTAMSSWISQKGEDEGDGSAASGSKMLQGIIVDGAISLGNIDAMANDADGVDNHIWISNDTMKKACPKVTLSNYQLIGVNWLALLHGMRCNVGKQDSNVNGVLADEMGLGKTVQTIAFFAWLKYRLSRDVVDLETGSNSGDGRALPHLIVVPVSVLPNWMREFETFCPNMNVMKFYGSQKERDELKEQLREHHPKYRSKTMRPERQLDVILAPVTYFQKESSADRKFLTGFKYDYLVCDEAHMLKNAKSTRYKMLDKVDTQHRLLLTGTPIQNNPQELLNMLSFIMPLFSRSEEEKAQYSEQMLKHFVDDKLENGDEEEAYKKLKQLFAPFVLRRKKNDVIAQLLPPKEQKVEFVALDDSARSVYQSIIEAHVKKNGKQITAAIGDHLFTNLRKAAHHPLLLRNRHTSPEEVEHLTSCFYKYEAFQGEGCTKARVGEELSRFNDFHIHLTAFELIQQNPHRQADLDRYTLQEEDLFSSAKFTRLRALLPELVSQDHRILIFSSWTSCLDLLGCLMEHLKLDYLRMDGSIASDERQRLIDQFNSDSTYSVFLLSTKACGLGINLTSADTCIIHDLDFNPFNDLQAEDRCHRIGQTKKVTVYKLVASDTVDSDIYKMQEKKSKMNAAIMDSASADKSIKRELLQSAVNRYLSSPERKAVLPDPANKENVDDDEIIL